MSDIGKEIDAQVIDAALKITDRIPYPWVLTRAILSVLETLVNLEKSDVEVRETIFALQSAIPTIWKDDFYNDDLDAAETTIEIDVRPSFCGYQPTREWCEQHDVTAFVEQKIHKYYDVLQACIDLLQRRGVLSKKQYKEFMLGVRARGVKHIQDDEFVEVL